MLLNMNYTMYAIIFIKHFCAQQVRCDLPGVFCRFLQHGQTRKNFFKTFRKGDV